MTSKKPSIPHSPPLFDDGVDPRKKFRHGVARGGTNRKTLQLCSQVADTLNQVLGDGADDVLLALHVQTVQPAPDSSQLLVIVGPAMPGEAVDCAAALASLHAASGRLRAAVSEAITRRRSPKLLFQVAPD
ncbi:MAG: hypothetical protein AB7O62_24720 [Pirellulales bacterium]